MIKNIHIWMASYIRRCMMRLPASTLSASTTRASSHPAHIIFTIVDHFEPKWGRPNAAAEERRVDAWVVKYPEMAKRHKDSDGRPPQHTFFYPEEEYEAKYLDRLSSLRAHGYGDVEMHLHHDHDTAEGLKKKIEAFKIKLQSHGLLSRDRTGAVRYGFIHGNWSLDNSRPDGRWCGVNNELEVLRDTGCYADFTLPSAPSDTQTSKINSIYYAKDTPLPKSHDKGIDVEAGKEPSGDLMIIQGPLTLNWKNRKFGIFPRIENGRISINNPPTRERVDMWVDQMIGVIGKPEWIFVKVYTHGAQDHNCTDRFFGMLDSMYSYMEEKYNDGVNFRLHYATAGEMYNMVKAAEAGERGELSEYREYVLVHS